jgi:primary-amine oxidase
MRVDPMIDGLNNSVCEVDVVPTDAPTGSDEVSQKLLLI